MRIFFFPGSVQNKRPTSNVDTTAAVRSQRRTEKFIEGQGRHRKPRRDNINFPTGVLKKHPTFNFGTTVKAARGP